MIATTIEQSRKLIELRLDETTANMYYPYLGAGQYGDIPRVGFPIEHSGGRDIPAWSLSALLEVMPKGTELTKMQNNANKLYYEIDYMYTGYEDSNPVTAAYEMVCWLLRNNLIEKGDNDE
jgi:hypothetical protein